MVVEQDMEDRGVGGKEKKDYDCYWVEFESAARLAQQRKVFPSSLSLPA